MLARYHKNDIVILNALFNIILRFHIGTHLTEHIHYTLHIVQVD